MAVLKGNRKESQFEVFHHMVKLRREITDLLLRDFGYSYSKSENYLSRAFGNKSYDELTEPEQAHYVKLKNRNEAFCNWFIIDERKEIVDCLRTIQSEIFIANSIYPMYTEELVERRIHQDLAIGNCHRLIQELQYAIETLPVDVNTYMRFAESIKKEINLIKGWRKSDNKFKRVISESGANFANVNNNGNANYNNASNSNGVRPDFDSVIK
jgi:hypothetical protein